MTPGSPTSMPPDRSLTDLPLAPLRILIVDDNPLDRAEAKAALLKGSCRPYHFIEATSAEQALLLCSQDPLPDCVVLDLALPDADELEVLERLPRDADDVLLVAVVVLTGATHLGLGQAVLRAGAHDYVGKAWLLPETLTQAVENAIERLAMAQVLQAQRQLVDAVRVRQQHLESENRQIREATRLKSEFLANMSHELRSPLTGIIGFADLLQMGAVLPGTPQFSRYLGHIGTCGRQLLRLINDLLDLAKVESGRLTFFPEPVDLGSLVAQVHELLRGEAERKHQLVEVDIDAGLGPLHLDPARLRQVVYSYLSNAIKFTPDGGHITVWAGPEGEHHFRLEVRDNGIGIAAVELPRLFTSHRQLDGSVSRKNPGAGLGLALASQLVQAQHGSVGVSSTPGLGSIFHLVLERRQDADAQQQAPVLPAA